MDIIINQLLFRGVHHQKLKSGVIGHITVEIIIEIGSYHCIISPNIGRGRNGNRIAIDLIPRVKELSHIFEIFYRVGNARIHPVEGTGIGLAIVRELTERMGGSISAESTVGVGTTFTLRLAQEVSLHTVPAQKRKDTHFIAPDCLILMVDDNAENLELLKRC